MYTREKFGFDPNNYVTERYLFNFNSLNIFFEFELIELKMFNLI